MKKNKWVAVCLISISPALYGGTAVWSSSVPGLWSDAANWDPKAVPSAEDDVAFEKNVTLSISGAAAKMNNLTIAPPGLAGGLQIENTPNSKLEIGGNLNQNGGSLAIRRANVTTEVNIHGNYNALAGQVLVLQKWRSPHLLVVEGNLNAGRKFTFRFALNGAKEFGAILVKGLTDLGNANLELYNLEGASCTNPRLLLIQNDSSNPLTGTFGNAKFGSANYSLNGHSYILTLGDYDGGGINNDVYLEEK